MSYTSHTDFVCPHPCHSQPQNEAKLPLIHLTWSFPSNPKTNVCPPPQRHLVLLSLTAIGGVASVTYQTGRRKLYELLTLSSKSYSHWLFTLLWQLLTMNNDFPSFIFHNKCCFIINPYVVFLLIQNVYNYTQYFKV